MIIWFEARQDTSFRVVLETISCPQTLYCNPPRYFVASWKTPFLEGLLWLQVKIPQFKEAAPKSSVYEGGVKTFSNKKGLVGRMTMIQSALYSSDLGEHFRYPQRHEKVYRKFFRDVWSQKLRQKVAKSRNFEASFWTWKMFFCVFHVFAPSACV